MHVTFFLLFARAKEKANLAMRSDLARAGDDLKGFDNAADGLMLKAGVLSLGVLSDDAQVDVGVPCLVARDVFDKYNRGVDVEFLSKRDVEGLVT